MSSADQVVRLRESVAQGRVKVSCLNAAARLGSEVAASAGGDTGIDYQSREYRWRVRVSLVPLPDETQRLLGCSWAEEVLPLFEREVPGEGRPRAALAALRRSLTEPSAENKEAASLAHQALMLPDMEFPAPPRWVALLSSVAAKRATRSLADIRDNKAIMTVAHDFALFPVVVESVMEAVASCRAYDAAIKTGVVVPEHYIHGFLPIVGGEPFDRDKDLPWRKTWDAAWNAAYRKSIEQHREDVIRELLTDRDNARA